MVGSPGSKAEKLTETMANPAHSRKKQKTDTTNQRTKARKSCSRGGCRSAPRPRRSAERLQSAPRPTTTRVGRGRRWAAAARGAAAAGVEDGGSGGDGTCVSESAHGAEGSCWKPDSGKPRSKRSKLARGSRSTSGRWAQTPS